MKQINDKDIASISVLTIDSRRPETIGLIKKHGINLPSNAPTQLVDKAFITLAKQNNKFREDFSSLAYDTSLSFTGSNEGNFFNNFTGKNEGNWFNSNGIQPSASQLAKNAGGEAAVKDLTSTDTTAKKSGFLSYLSDLFTPEFSRDILNTGLNVWSNKQIGQNAPTTQNVLDDARFELQDKTTTTAAQGMGVGSIILISVGALALIGGIIYFVRKK
jgi:hypothetical protein